MISKSFNVNIFGSLSENLYSGYISGESYKGGSVFVITRKTAYEFFRGIVIAIATFADNGEEKLIIAPQGEIFYEPEIRAILTSYKKRQISRLICLYEKSCGALVFYQDNNENVKILLVKNHNGRHWSFPKGHVELYEKEECTAKREIKEETDLDVEIYDGFREVTDYCPYGNIRKQVVFFLAESQTDNVVIQESEIDSYTWATPSQAHRLCSYDNDHKLIDRAVEFLKNRLKKLPQP